MLGAVADANVSEIPLFECPRSAAFVSSTRIARQSPTFDHFWCRRGAGDEEAVLSCVEMNVTRRVGNFLLDLVGRRSFCASLSQKLKYQPQP